MKRQIAGLCAAVLVLLAGCSGPEEANPAAPLKEPLAAKEPIASEITPQPRAPVKRDIPEDYAAVRSALRAFSYETAAAFWTEPGRNETYSPLSLYYALAMTSAGAAGETKAQLLDLLGVESQTAVNGACERLYDFLYTDRTERMSRMANAIWMAQGFDFLDDYVSTVCEDYYGALFTADFENPGLADIVADWIAEQTGGTLRPSLILSPNTVLLLINTVYFKDRWKAQFGAEATEPGSFQTRDGSVQAPFMHGTDEHTQFTVGDGFLRAARPLSGGGRIVFVLPDVGVDLASLTGDADAVRRALEEGEPVDGTVHWTMPKFTSRSSYDLNAPLQALGVTDAFRSERADFSNMAAEPVYLGAVQQQTYFALDENGVDASVATEIFVEDAAAMQEAEACDMVLDRPFLYAVEVGGIWLFLGICADPTQF